MLLRNVDVYPFLTVPLGGRLSQHWFWMLYATSQNIYHIQCTVPRVFQYLPSIRKSRSLFWPSPRSIRRLERRDPARWHSGSTRQFSVCVKVAGSSKCLISDSMWTVRFLWPRESEKLFVNAMQHLIVSFSTFWTWKKSSGLIQWQQWICHLNLLANPTSPRSLSVSNLWPLYMHFVYSLYK